MTKQKKNELTEEVGVEEDEKNGTYGNAELPVAHTSQTTHSSPQKAFYAVIREALAKGQGISLPGLGSFSVMLHAARMGRNPRTGETIAIPARRRIHFKTCKGLRELLNP
ncbi:HU family DNA-binding protein [Desulfomicrobium baculatum]|uniref:Histone family protein DNA-binding protein n=1 Tax=Desulfomicrobium baculatum (strain DSM 4028 / VKM B-1378 / X) TaxID=525897 RepID=C7LTK6_DESBD|nr:HU family DNA-binding protein [Desulfomicrobium baculatum]ACU90772.1 histone family protein DNA-binding protein [Desulfomicrobium baculatum DSM 4028]